MPHLIDDLQAEAARLGFQLSGVTNAGPPPHVTAYERWLAQARHAGMDYLSRDRARAARADLDQVLPGVRSVLMLAMRYPDPRSLGEPDTTAGRVAAYAWGRDYHHLIPPRLRELVERLVAITGRSQENRAYTDTGPVLERDLAQRAGLGWAGKNTCLIHPRHGSYFLLAEIFLTEELPPTPPLETDHCGQCRRCIDACPTGCIEEDRTIDAGRCISYLTIENKGEIPDELRPQMGDWVFGCDICQQVCPWNLRFSDRAAGSQFEPREQIGRPVLREELRLSPQDFNRKFKDSPLLRAKRRGYLRNVCVALGNRADPGSVPDLLMVLGIEPEPLVRAHAAWALGQIGTPAARAGLDNSRRVESDPRVLDEINRALARSG